MERRKMGLDKRDMKGFEEREEDGEEMEDFRV